MTLTALFDGKIGTFLLLLLGLGVLAYVAWLLFRVFGDRLKAAGHSGRPSRLGIVEAFELDRHRQLVIIRRDNVEHLLMIGGPNDLVVEEAIARPAGTAAFVAPAAAPVSAPVSTPQSEPRRETPASPPAPPVTTPFIELAPEPVMPRAAPMPPMPSVSPMPRKSAAPVEPAPMVKAPEKAPEVAPPTVAVAKPKDPQRLSMNINFLEEEMTRLMGRAPEKPKE